MKPKLTVLLGAGATLAAGAPSTEDLTNQVERLRRPAALTSGTPFLLTQDPSEKPLSFAYSVPKPVCEIVATALKSDYRQVDFELILAALEELDSFVAAKRGLGMLDRFRPVISTFADLSSSFHTILDERAMLSATRMEVIRCVFDCLLAHAANSSEGSELAMRSVFEFFERLQEHFHLTVFTLNYDDIIDRAPISWFDGFGPASVEDKGITYQLFDRRNFVERFSDDDALVHLHGSVRFGWALTARTFETVKFGNTADARKSVDAWRGDRSDRGTIVSTGPIVSGFHKVAKIAQNPAPFGYYYRAFIDSLIECPRLLVVGYSGRDEHVNTWLQEHAAIHGRARRIGFVSKMSLNDMFERRPEWDILGILSGESGINEPPTNLSGEFQVRGLAGMVLSGFPFPGAATTINRLTDFLDS